MLEDRQKLVAAEQSFISALKSLKSYPVPFATPFKSEADITDFSKQFGVTFTAKAENVADITAKFKDELAELRHQIIADLAMVLEKQERWDDADPLHRHVVLTQAEALRADLPHVAFSLQNLPLPEEFELRCGARRLYP